MTIDETGDPQTKNSPIGVLFFTAVLGAHVTAVPLVISLSVGERTITYADILDSFFDWASVRLGLARGRLQGSCEIFGADGTKTLSQDVIERLLSPRCVLIRDLQHVQRSATRCSSSLTPILRYCFNAPSCTITHQLGKLLSERLGSRMPGFTASTKAGPDGTEYAVYESSCNISYDKYRLMRWNFGARRGGSVQ